MRGPQVTPGYVDVGREQPFRGGWLATGDLGHRTADGFLVIDGRRRSCSRPPTASACTRPRSRRCPGAARRGRGDGGGHEGRPYCAALLWTEQPSGAAPAGLEQAMAAVNARLERPEQVRRWVVLPYDLTVEGGELTTNLKLRRAVVAERLGDVIASLYDRAPAAARRSRP